MPDDALEQTPEKDIASDRPSMEPGPYVQDLSQDLSLNISQEFIQNLVQDLTQNIIQNLEQNLSLNLGESVMSHNSIRDWVILNDDVITSVAAREINERMRAKIFQCVQESFTGHYEDAWDDVLYSFDVVEKIFDSPDTTEHYFSTTDFSRDLPPEASSAAEYVLNSDAYEKGVRQAKDKLYKLLISQNLS